MEKDYKKIITILKKGKCSFNELKQKLSINPSVLYEQLEELKDCLVIKQKKDLYYYNNEKRGILRVHKSGEYGFIECNNKEYYVPCDNFNGAIDQDYVSFDTSFTSNGMIADVIEFKRNKKHNVIGEVKEIDEKKVFEPYNSIGNMQISLRQGQLNNMPIGAILEVNILNQYDLNGYRGKIVRFLGIVDNKDSDILASIIKNGIPIDYTPEYQEELKNVPTKVTKREMKGRKDLRKKQIFTIDGKNTKDIDDAVGIERLNNGNYKLYISIADVSHYVLENSHIDCEAYKRGTSVYPVNRVYPMFHPDLSNGICSLNPNTDRLALTVELELDKNANIVKGNIYESVINSKKQMTYEEVNKLLEKGLTPHGYSSFKESLLLLNDLSLKLNKKRKSRGCIDFSLPEVEIVENDSGEVTNLNIKKLGRAEDMIEDLMLITNEFVCQKLASCVDVLPYRVHEIPEENKVSYFVDILNYLGMDVEIGDFTSPEAYQKVLKEIEKQPNFQTVLAIALKSFPRAKYSVDNIGHYGLSLNNYTHFTSPIRRYPDLIIHRLVKKHILKKNIALNRDIKESCNHLSNCQVRADKCEREIIRMKLAKYMEDKINQEFVGTVSCVNNNTLFVQLDDSQIEGEILLNSLPIEFKRSENRVYLTFVNECRLGVGDRINVVLKDADHMSGTIIFEYKSEEKQKVKR